MELSATVNVVEYVVVLQVDVTSIVRDLHSGEVVQL